MFVAIAEPFDFDLTLARFRANGLDLLNTMSEAGYSRVLEGREVRLATADGGVAVSPSDPSLEGPVRRLLGAADDLVGFARSAGGRGDEPLERLLSSLHGLRLALVPDPYEMLVASITAQQISQAAALAVRNRLVERFGTRHGAVYEFPGADALAGAGEDALCALGLSRPKAQAVVAVASSRVDFQALRAQPDQEVIEQLMGLRGIGRWSAEWYLVRHLGRVDVWPAGDLALRRAVGFY
ncbi:MAG: DNA-3-methyladenine glycosylase family protein, partial [Gaiellales bacterium]